MSVDVVVEGKITPEEGMDEVLQTMVDMKSLVHGILRVTCGETSVNGRIGFAHDGYILGAKVNVTNETGYEALRKLLSITQGNYAVLDAADQQQHSELNQTLWIKAQKIIPEIRVSKLKNQSGLLGAAYMALHYKTHLLN